VKTLRPSLFLIALSLPMTMVVACGGSMQQNQSGVLQSITISPAVADAQTFPSGEVQFTATGVYNTQPSPVNGITATWGVCQQNAPTTAVTISQTGLAQCTTAAKGTFSVFAEDFSGPVVCLAISVCGGGCEVAGFAQLTCP
jgi:hypothetical protein